MRIVRLALRRTYTFVMVGLIIAVLGGVSIYRMSTDRPCRSESSSPHLSGQLSLSSARRTIDETGAQVMLVITRPGGCRSRGGRGTASLAIAVALVMLVERDAESASQHSQQLEPRDANNQCRESFYPSSGTRGIVSHYARSDRDSDESAYDGDHRGRDKPTRKRKLSQIECVCAMKIVAEYLRK
jgi:hypothetical protein